MTSTPWSWCGATSSASSWPTCAPTPSTKQKPPPRPASNESAPAISCASTSSTTPDYLYDHTQDITETSLMGSDPCQSLDPQPQAFLAQRCRAAGAAHRPWGCTPCESASPGSAHCEPARAGPGGW